MARYIDADNFLQILDAYYAAYVERQDWSAIDTIRQICQELKDAPTADVVEVCRCKDCKYYNTQLMTCYNNEFPFHCESRPIMREDDFCSYGERRA